MKKASSKTKTVMAYLEGNPNAKPADVAKRFKMAVGYVYKLRGDIKLDKALTMSKPSAALLIKSSSKKEDLVNHPAHYKTGGIETIDFIEAKELDFHLGNVIKYIARAEHKGSKLENLQKAQFYLNRAVSKLESK